MAKPAKAGDAKLKGLLNGSQLPKGESFMRKYVKIASFAITILILINTVSIASAAIANVNVDETNAVTGLLKISCNIDTEKKLKVILQKDSSKYIYNIKKNGAAENFPLQLGKGTYLISVFENIEGTKYRKIFQDDIFAEINNQNAVYLNSVQNISWNYENTAIQKAELLTSNLNSDKERINVLYSYIVKNFSYDYNKVGKLTTEYLPDIDKIYNAKKGICYDYSSLFAAMLRSLGIPAKLVKGYAEGVKGYHAWNEVFDKSSGKWLTIDTTADSQYSKAKRKYTMIKTSGYRKVNEY